MADVCSLHMLAHMKVWPNLIAQLELVGGGPHFLCLAEPPQLSFWLLSVSAYHTRGSILLRYTCLRLNLSSLQGVGWTMPTSDQVMGKQQEKAG